MKSSIAMRSVAIAAVSACAMGAHAAARSSVSYVADLVTFGAYLVDWNTARHTAHVTETLGQSDATYTDDGTQRLVTLATPITLSTDTFDDCGQAITQTNTLNQLVFRPVSGTAKKGTAQVVEIGTITNVGGCAPGTTPYGAPTDAGTTTSLLDMTLRASIADLGPGAQLAGMSETTAAAVDYPSTLVEQVVTFGPGTVTFNGTGDVVSKSKSNGWIVLDFGSFERGYTRLTRDATSGLETWLGALWVNGAPANVQNLLMVEPNAAAGFGTRNQAAHSWFEALFQNQDPLPYFDLYQDLTGGFIYRSATDGSVQSTMPLTWGFIGADIRIKRSYDFTVNYRQRTWVPLANYGKNHFVMENEDLYDAAGNFQYTIILPRVNYYVDQGKAIKPAVAGRPQVAARSPGTTAGQRPN